MIETVAQWVLRVFWASVSLVLGFGMIWGIVTAFGFWHELLTTPLGQLTLGTMLGAFGLTVAVLVVAGIATWIWEAKVADGT